ncbi:DUF2254 domain-containing protein [Tropicibacter naphthalenivorans]|uniref:DUF2254 domain-containing protein n=1 Tax=Tropicibacter naphthalenivorans TaxID=441103 RepID=A0A0P1GCA4_9RHOB|nr:DUF2254 domain-containing protein [Tropicibacter naphthalenivorans]CUH79106.1 hypothetical protein TRN7648_02335 [Tropicibacter naphthalenivorans]SMD03463.1 Uncharacterized membrane protein [Tropicibacter naphthalenivorans]
MISKRVMQLLRLSKKLSVRVMLMTLLALVAVLVAPLADTLIPDALKERFGEQAALPVLNILAASMLTVTTFSLGVMVQASQSASSLATPRAYRILMEDTTTQTVLATFVGSFLFSLTAIAMFRAHYYDTAAAVVVFFMTAFVIAAIITALIRWIGHLSQLGSMDHILHLVEDAARPPLQALMDRPALGGHIAGEGVDAPPNAVEICAKRSGYIQFVDMPALQESMAQGGHMWLAKMPGTYVIEGDVLARTTCARDVNDAVCDCFTIAKSRSLEQDARFGLMVLAETASRALSPGVNDPGTAIDVIHRLTQLLADCAGPSQVQPQFDHITAPAIQARDLAEDAYDVLIRDGAERPEVMEHILAAQVRLIHSAWPEMAQAADEKIAYAYAHIDAAGMLAPDRARMESVAAPR